MKCFGQIYSDGNWWFIKTEPHVLMKLKAVFGRVDKGTFETVKLRHSPEVARDLEWFLSRYPMENKSAELLSLSSKLHQLTLEQMEEMTRPEYVPTARPLAHELRDYQARMVDLYLQRKFLLCADTLGLGKSIEAIATFTEPKTLPALIVCKPHLIQQWKDYCHDWMPGLTTHVIKQMEGYDLPKADVYFITYNKLWAWTYELASLVSSAVFDEVQELRRVESNKHKAARELRARLKYCLGLSATPIYNYGGEIWNIMRIICGSSHIGTREEFEREWCVGRGQYATLQDPNAFGTYLREQFLMVRRTRAEVGRELPPVQSIVEQVDYDVKVLDDIDSIATELAHLVVKGTFQESGMAARELDARLRQATGIAKAPFVAAFTRMIVQGEGEPVLLVGWHRTVYDIWHEHLKQFNPVYYTGTESPKQKDEAKKKFMSGESKVMFLSLRSGEGLDGLQKVCRTVVFGELDWSPGIHEQVRGRLFRDGQKHQVTEFYLVSNAGSDPVVATTLGLKTAQLHGILSPDEKEPAKAQMDPQRIKRLAEEYLRAKRTKPADEPEEPDLPTPSMPDLALQQLAS